MRILIANYEFPPIGGGASTVSFKLATTLAKQGHDVFVLTSRYGDAPQVETLDGIVVHRVWSWRIGIHDCGVRGAITYLLAALPRLYRILHDEHIDVVHYFFGLPTGLLSLYSHSIRKVPYVVSLRGSDVPLYDLDSEKLLFLHRLTKPVSHRIWRNASQVVAVSHGLRELAEASFPDVRVGVIHNGVDLNATADVRGARSDDDRRRLICVSRLIPRKGLTTLLDALASLPGFDFELTVIGSGPSEADLRERSRALGIADKIKFLGYLGAEEVRAHYVESDMFVLPTYSDAFANVILEAMSAGLPVVACRVGGVAEAVVDGATGILVGPRRPDELAAAIRKLANDDELRVKFGLAGQQRVRDMFTWNENVMRYTDAYVKATNSAALGTRPEAG